MAKNNFLLVNLNESKTKKLAETITSDTSRKILNYLVEREDTETKIAENLQIPISTTHYHLQKLQEAGLVKVEEFHYSPKGREVNHYKLANKYIIIAPGNISGLKEKLKGILPVAILAVGISVVIKLLERTTFTAVESKAMAASYDLTEAAPMLATATTRSQPDIALWFFIGSMAAIGLYLAIAVVREWLKK